MYKFITAVLGPLARLLFRLKITYEAPLPKSGPVLVCGKHISAPDPFFAMIAYSRPVHFMAKESLYRNKFFGWFLTKMNAFPIIRGSADKKSFETALEVLNKGNVIGIFPEGTRVRSIENVKLKTGAMNLAVRTGAEIIPFGIYTEGYKVKLFKRTYIRFGKPIKVDMLDEETITKSDLQHLTDTVLLPEILRLSQKDYTLQV